MIKKSKTDKLKRLNSLAAEQRESKDLQQKLGALNKQVESLGPFKKLADIAGGFESGASKGSPPPVVFQPPSLNELREKASGAQAPPASVGNDEKDL